MPDLSLANVVSWWVQVAAVAVAGLLLPLALGLRSPRPRLLYLRGLFLFCLALPLVQTPVRMPMAAEDELEAAGVAPDREEESRLRGPGGARTAPSTDRAAPAGFVTPGRLEQAAVAAYVCGFALRLGWLGLGLLSLRRLRRSSSALAPRPPALDAAAALVGAGAEFRASPRVLHPVTFGVRRPVVLVPQAFLSFEPSQQTAVATHELLHVRRRDWLRTMADQLVLCACWFHPVLWWLVERMDVAAEQVVDRAAVALVGDRRPYLKALLDLAAAGADPLPGPASAFANRSHLAERVALLLREVTMSRLRLVSSFAAMAAVLAAGTWYAVGAYPLTVTLPELPAVAARGTAPAGAAPAAPLADPLLSARSVNATTPVNPQSRVPGVVTPSPREWPRLVEKGSLAYPAPALAERRGGIVGFHLAIDRDGRVTSVQVSYSAGALGEPSVPRQPASNDLVAAASASVRLARFAALSRPWPRYPLAIRFDPDSGQVDWLPVPPPPPPPPPPASAAASGGTAAGASAGARAARDFSGFDARVREMTSQLEAEPGNLKARYGLAMLYWERAYGDHTLAEAQKREYLALGLGEADLALAGNPQFVEALVAKNLLLRTQALIETDQETRRSLIAEADRLRAEALRLRDVPK